MGHCGGQGASALSGTEEVEDGWQSGSEKGPCWGVGLGPEGAEASVEEEVR